MDGQSAIPIGTPALEPRVAAHPSNAQVFPIDFHGELATKNVCPSPRLPPIAS